ncbi:MAG: hypothetical protein H0X30_07075 [Anaerolineae bacterium]|nr:hypothetical protein [Anaerolineae bacterium]
MYIQTVFKRSKQEKRGRIFVLEIVTECHLTRKGIKGHFPERIERLFKRLICDFWGEHTEGLMLFEKVEPEFERSPNPFPYDAYGEPRHIINHLSTAAKNERNSSSNMHKLRGGGITGAIRCICVISVALAEPPAATK